MIEINLTDDLVYLAAGGSKSPRKVELDPAFEDGYFESFLREAAGEEGEISPSTREVLQATRITLAIQEAADNHLHNVPLPAP